MKLEYYCNCVNWPKNDVDGLCDMIDSARTISRGTFRLHVDCRSRHELEASLGYAIHARNGLTMEQDYHVTYYRSTLHGVPVYFFKWSAIEHVFTIGGQPIKKAA